MARGLPTGGQGSKVDVLCAEPKEHKRFRPGTRPGGPVLGVVLPHLPVGKKFCVFVLCDLVKTDLNGLKLTKTD